MNFRKVEVDIEILSPRERVAWIHRLAGKTARETAALMSCNPATVHMLWLRSRQRSTAYVPQPLKVLDHALSRFGRCACGLLLPCVCLPTIGHVAASRPGAE